MTVFITGPLRSGKSDFAKELALERGGPVLVIATARVDPNDREFVARVERHRRDRPVSWTTIECAGPPRLELGRLITQAPPDATVLVDSLGTWLADHLIEIEPLANEDPAAALASLESVASRLIEALRRPHPPVICISEETGWSLVPTTVLGRIFSDALGRLNRAVALIADQAFVVVAGYAIDLKAGRSVRS